MHLHISLFPKHFCLQARCHSKTAEVSWIATAYPNALPEGCQLPTFHCHPERGAGDQKTINKRPALSPHTSNPKAKCSDSHSISGFTTPLLSLHTSVSSQALSGHKVSSRKPGISSSLAGCALLVLQSCHDLCLADFCDAQDTSPLTPVPHASCDTSIRQPRYVLTFPVQAHQRRIVYRLAHPKIHHQTPQELLNVNLITLQTTSLT